MTREEIADKFEELARGVREGKTLQATHDHGVSWIDADKGFIAETLRIKPEPKYVPFTEDDWREFFKKKIIQIDTQEEREVVLFCTSSVRLTDGHWLIWCSYDNLCDKYIFCDTGKPVGKKEGE